MLRDSRRAARRRPGPESATVTCCAASSESARKPSAERSASGSSRCQTSVVEVDVSSIERELELVMVGAEVVGDEACVRELVLVAGLANPTENVFTGSVMFRAISATIRLESSPPLSIAPSGTSLISRSRTARSSRSRSSLRPLRERPPRPATARG